MRKNFYFFLKDDENLLIVMYDKLLKKQFFFNFRLCHNDVVIGRLRYDLKEIKDFFYSHDFKEVQTFEIFFNEDILKKIKKIINIYKNDQGKYYIDKSRLDIWRMSEIKQVGIVEKTLDKFLLNFKKYLEKEAINMG